MFHQPAAKARRQHLLVRQHAVARTVDNRLAIQHFISHPRAKGEGQVQLGDDWAVNFAMVAHKHAGRIGVQLQSIRADYLMVEKRIQTPHEHSNFQLLPFLNHRRCPPSFVLSYSIVFMPFLQVRKIKREELRKQDFPFMEKHTSAFSPPILLYASENAAKGKERSVPPALCRLTAFLRPARRSPALRRPSPGRKPDRSRRGASWPDCHKNRRCRPDARFPNSPCPAPRGPDRRAALSARPALSPASRPTAAGSPFPIVPPEAPARRRRRRSSHRK